MVKNEENCFPIINYNNITITFNISEIDPDNETGTCFKLNKSIFQGEYECISKPSHTFYVLDNELNTGIIKNCSKECDSFITEENICINCSSNYYKTEDSNNNCLLTPSESFNLSCKFSTLSLRSFIFKAMSSIFFFKLFVIRLSLIASSLK